jgi:hypothetical protein
MLTGELQEKVLFLDCDEPDVRKEMTDVTSTRLIQRFGDAKVVMIDEAQRIQNIGITLKLIHDKIKSVQLIVTGSYSLELNSEISEPLTGRKYEFLLLPLSTPEMIKHTNVITEKKAA